MNAVRNKDDSNVINLPRRSFGTMPVMEVDNTNHIGVR
jgi:hypothetical protein